MVVLGIDPGFAVSGFAVICKQKGQDVFLDTGYLSLPSKEHLSKRIGIFHSFFTEKIKEWKITHISLETPFLGKNVQSFLKLGYLRGTLYFLANQHNLQLCEFSPKEVKRAVTGYGGAQKDQVARTLLMLFPQVPAPSKEDVTDAMAISLCGLWQLGVKTL